MSQLVASGIVAAVATAAHVVQTARGFLLIGSTPTKTAAAAAAQSPVTRSSIRAPPSTLATGPSSAPTTTAPSRAGTTRRTPAATSLRVSASAGPWNRYVGSIAA